jgi:hypothetical protein
MQRYLNNLITLPSDNMTREVNFLLSVFFHGTRVEKGVPCLVQTGSDRADPNIPFQRL